MFFQKDLETMSRDEIKELQLTRLRETVKWCYDRVPHYRAKMDDADVSPDMIRTLDDLRRIPFTTKADMRDNYPFGLLAVPKRELVRIHASSGTTGKPTVGGYTREDLRIWSECVARLAAAAGATDEDMVQISFGYGLFTGALGLHQGLELIGATIVPISSGNTERQLMLMEDFEATVLVATPSYAVYLGEAVKAAGILPKLKLRLGLFGAEGCTPEMRTKIEKNLGVFATDNYGMTELMGPGVAGECELRCGLHLAEDHFIAEIIDPETCEPIPEGEFGELVITPVTRRGFPVLRYRTKDITRLITEPCECGRTHARLDKIRGRSDDMLIIKGVNVFPSQIEAALMTISGVSAHYQLVVTTEDYMDCLTVNVELAEDFEDLDSYSALENLQGKIRQKLLSVLGLSAKVVLVSPGSLERFQGKAKRVVDQRVR